MAGEGHFLALLKKEGASEPPVRNPFREGKVSKNDRKILEEFFCEVSGITIDQIEIRKGQVYYRSGLPGEQKGLTFLRNGLYLGELKKDRFEPGQAFAVALKKEEYAPVLDFDQADERVITLSEGRDGHCG